MIEYVNYTSIFLKQHIKLYILMSIKICLEKEWEEKTTFIP